MFTNKMNFGGITKQRAGTGGNQIDYCLKWRPGPRLAFTLIEVLVVVAIIALLAAILLPSLQRAREQARIAICAANSKQIATITATYQGEYKGYVPIVFNEGSKRVMGNDKPPRSIQYSLLSVALRAYDAGLKNLQNVRVPPEIQATDGGPDTLSLSSKWSFERQVFYEKTVMPKYYACPFGRDTGSSEFIKEGSFVLAGKSIDKYRIDGLTNAYVVQGWEGEVIRGMRLTQGGANSIWPTDNAPVPSATGPVDGRPKYSALSWNCRYLEPPDKYYPFGPPPGFMAGARDEDELPDTANPLLTKHRRWIHNDAQRLRSAGLSDVTVFFCNHGETVDDNPLRIRNMNSHRTGLGGGTNAAFADSHVEWVRGTQIGWQ